jgi:hypothetical protein
MMEEFILKLTTWIELIKRSKGMISFNGLGTLKVYSQLLHKTESELTFART